MSVYSDCLETISKRDMWIYLGWLEIRLRYRRSIIGPLWITISMAVFVTVLGVVYSKILGAGSEEYIPAMAIGFIIWSYISAICNESCNTFVAASALIKDGRTNLLSVTMISIWKNSIIFFTIR